MRARLRLVTLLLVLPYAVPDPPTRREQPSNMTSDDSTAETSKEVEAYMVVRDEQPQNIAPMSVTLEVSKEDRSSSFRELHPTNIPLLVVTP